MELFLQPFLFVLADCCANDSVQSVLFCLIVVAITVTLVAFEMKVFVVVLIIVI